MTQGNALMMQWRGGNSGMKTIKQYDTVHIFLDDIRDPPDDKWIIARNAMFAYHVIEMSYQLNRKIVISLDHDLGEGISTGYDLLNWIEENIALNEDFRPEIAFLIHSANPVGRDNMARAIKAIEKMLA